MQKRTLTILCVAVAILIGSCARPKPEIRPYSDFLVQSDCDFGDMPSQMLEYLLMTHKPFGTSDHKMAFHYKYKFYFYDFATKSYQYLAKQEMGDQPFCCPDTSTLWYTYQRKELINALGDKRLPFKAQMPYYDTSFAAVSYAELPIVNNRLYTTVFNTNPDVSPDAYKHFPRAAIWQIQDDTLLFERLFATLPDNFPHDNYGANQPARFIFNPDDSVLVFYNGALDDVQIYDLDGNHIADHYLGSQYFTTPPDLSLNDFYDLSKFIEYGETHTLYKSLYYDPYRKVYLRTMLLPADNDTNSMEKASYSTIIIVADRDFNILYEVLFDNSDYHVFLRLMPRPEGVYVMRKVSEYETRADLFVFD